MMNGLSGWLDWLAEQFEAWWPLFPQQRHEENVSEAEKKEEFADFG